MCQAPCVLEMFPPFCLREGKGLKCEMHPTAYRNCSSYSLFNDIVYHHLRTCSSLVPLWIVDVWCRVYDEITVCALCKCGMSSTLDTMEDDCLWGDNSCDKKNGDMDTVDDD